MFLLLFFVSYLNICKVSSVIIRDYNKVDYYQYNNSNQLQHHFFPQNKAITNILLGQASQRCSYLLNTPSFQGVQKFVGSVIVSASIPYTDDDEEHCAQLFWYSAGSNFESPKSVFELTELFSDSLESWIFENTHTEVSLTNGFNYPIKLMWKDETSKSSSLSGIIEPQESVLMNTFLGHIFYALKLDDDEIVDYMVINGLPYTFSPQNRLETCDNADSDILTLEISCSNMEMRLDAFTHDIWMHKRIGLNFVQPQIVPAVTDDGFKLIKLPTETYSWLKSWYDHKKELEHEEETSAGPCMNQHKAPSEMTHLPHEEKLRLTRELQPILEEWYGKGPLEMTSIYGIRKYTNNSILRMHVDTLATHVVSAIINVDQDVVTPWKLLILDHNDEEHELEMQPGDMVLYESAKLLHGRPVPMNGLRYENIFIHFKPTTGWNYY